MTREERLKKREELKKKGIKFEDNSFVDHFQEVLDTYTPDELLEELKECGLELTVEEKKKWIEPIIIDTVEDAERFVQAMEQAAAAPKKDVEVNYKEITDIDEIKRIFHKLNERVECWETLCLENSNCDVYEVINGDAPFCCKKIKDCPNRILLDNL